MSAGHPSSSSIYPACFAPYEISTACTDGKVRFWKCGAVENETGERTEDNDKLHAKFEWKEWEMMIRTEESRAVKVPGTCNAKLLLYITMFSNTSKSLKIKLVPVVSNLHTEYWNKNVLPNLVRRVVIHQCVALKVLATS